MKILKSYLIFALFLLLLSCGNNSTNPQNNNKPDARSVYHNNQIVHIVKSVTGISVDEETYEYTTKVYIENNYLYLLDVNTNDDRLYDYSIELKTDSITFRYYTSDKYFTFPNKTGNYFFQNKTNTSVETYYVQWDILNGFVSLKLNYDSDIHTIEEYKFYVQ
jgi:hypothetical protein